MASPGSMAPQPAARRINDVSDRGCDAIHDGCVTLRPPRNPADQKNTNDAGRCSDLRPAERRLHHPPLLGSFDLRLFGEPILNIAPGRIAALKKSVQKVSPTGALSRKFRADARCAHLFKFFTLIDRQHALANNTRTFCDLRKEDLTGLGRAFHFN